MTSLCTCMAASYGERILTVRQHLAKLQATLYWHFFSDPLWFSRAILYNAGTLSVVIFFCRSLCMPSQVQASLMARPQGGLEGGQLLMTVIFIIIIRCV